jgi:hypothetical protein
VVYQKLVNKKKIPYIIDDSNEVANKKNKKKGVKSEMWMKGVFFYTQAIPAVVVSNVLYFVDFRKLASKLSTKIISKHPWLKLTQQPVQSDIHQNLELQYDRKYQGLGNHHDDGWRQQIIFYAQVIPAACLLIDFFLNKIKIRMGHLTFNILFNMLFFLLTTVN